MPNQRYIYVILTQTGTNISKAIKCFTRAPFNHVSVSGDAELCEMFSFCRLYKHRPLPAGFLSEKIDGGVFGLFKIIPCQIFRLEATEQQFEKYNDIIELFKKDTRLYSYSILGLLTIALGIPFERKNRFVCSQFVAHVLSEAGITKFTKPLSLVRPDDFRYLTNADLIFAGDIKNYHAQMLRFPKPNLNF